MAARPHKCGGLLCGEHGKDLRSEHVPDFFEELYPSPQALKCAFNLHNPLNPRKICTPPDSAEDLIQVDGVTLRGDLDRTIHERVWQDFPSTVHYNVSAP